jgi:hypothetical protein
MDWQAGADVFFKVCGSVQGACYARFFYDDEPTVNFQDELAVATSGSHNLRRRSNG